MFRRTFLKSTAAITFAGSARAQSNLPPLRVAGNTSTIELSPVLVAAAGIYRGPVTVSNGGVPNLVNGTADIATNAETQLLRASVDDPSLRIISTVAESFYRVVGRKSAGITKAADLRGKRITVPRNTSAHWFLVKTLRAAGVNEDEYTFVQSPANQMAQALKERRVDAVSMWEPESELAIEAAGDDAIVIQDRSLYRELFNLNSTARVLTNPEMRRAVVEFQRAIIQASEQLRNNPAPHWPLVSGRTGFSVEMIGKCWPNLRFAGSLVDDVLNVITEEEVWVAKERSRMPRPRGQLSTLIDPSILAQALQPNLP